MIPPIGHVTQFVPPTWSSGADCNMQAAADAARWATLGLEHINHAEARALSGDTSGGTNIDQAHLVLDKLGVLCTVYHSSDGQTWADVESALRSGNTVIAHGDYGSVPVKLRGPADKTYTGYHSVLFVEITGTDVRVADSLNPKLTTWPIATVSAYMRDFPGGGYTYLVVRHRVLAARVVKANVRPNPNRHPVSDPFATITSSSRVHCGGTVRGESIGGNAAWFKVWVHNRIGYVHSSVGRYI